MYRPENRGSPFPGSLFGKRPYPAPDIRFVCLTVCGQGIDGKGAGRRAAEDRTGVRSGVTPRSVLAVSVPCPFGYGWYSRVCGGIFAGCRGSACRRPAKRRKELYTMGEPPEGGSPISETVCFGDCRKKAHAVRRIERRNSQRMPRRFSSFAYAAALRLCSGSVRAKAWRPEKSAFAQK